MTSKLLYIIPIICITSCGSLFQAMLPDASTHVVIFDSMGGSYVESEEVEDRDYLTEPESPSKENFIFDGWYSEEYNNTKWDFTNDYIEEDMILYAKWTEHFDSADKPSTQLLSYNSDSTKTYKLLTPWNYENSYNASRSYPLVIALHGSTTLTNHYYIPTIVGNEEEMMDFPCFYLAPNNSNLGWSGTSAAWVRNLVTDLISQYRIDTNRIYIIGFSMGGSGSYYFTEDLYSDKGLIAAGIVRCAGMSNSDLPLAIASKISVWYNVGLSDDTDIQQCATDAYDYMEGLSCYSGAEETIENDILGGNARQTFTLTLNSLEFIKLSRFTGIGHTDAPVWDDPYVLKWLFFQSLENR